MMGNRCWEYLLPVIFILGEKTQRDAVESAEVRVQLAMNEDELVEFAEFGSNCFDSFTVNA